MMKQNVLVISTSLRKNSNSEILAKEFEKGAKAAGNTVEFISLANKQIGFCIGCLSCLKSKKCFMKDDAANIAEKVQHADVIAFATPIYYYEMCGQMKTLLDRMNPLYTSEYAFRDIYLLTTAAENDESAMDGAVKGMQGWIDCFEQARLARRHTRSWYQRCGNCKRTYRIAARSLYYGSIYFLTYFDRSAVQNFLYSLLYFKNILIIF